VLLIKVMAQMLGAHLGFENGNEGPPGQLFLDQIAFGCVQGFDKLGSLIGGQHLVRRQGLAQNSHQTLHQAGKVVVRRHS
jgi:hypothetical protein